MNPGSDNSVANVLVLVKTAKELDSFRHLGGGRRVGTCWNCDCGNGCCGSNCRIEGTRTGIHLYLITFEFQQKLQKWEIQPGYREQISEKSKSYPEGPRIHTCWNRKRRYRPRKGI